MRVKPHFIFRLGRQDIYNIENIIGEMKPIATGNDFKVVRAKSYTYYSEISDWEGI